MDEFEVPGFDDLARVFPRAGRDQSIQPCEHAGRDSEGAKVLEIHALGSGTQEIGLLRTEHLSMSSARIYLFLCT